MALRPRTIDDAAMAPTLDIPHGSPLPGHDWMVGHGPPVLVGPLDGSDPSRRTTALAAGLARRLGWRLALVPVPLGATARDRRERLIAAAMDERAELIASPAANHGPSDGAGAAACLALADAAPCPVLAVPPIGRWRPTASGSIVCGIDDSDGSASVARFAARLALSLGARLELVHLAAPPDGGARRRGGASGACMGLLWRALQTLEVMPPVDVVLELGEPAQRLCALAESARTLLVIGTPANAATNGERGGGVASTILAESRVPVVLVPGRAAEVAGVPVTAGSEVAA